MTIDIDDPFVYAGTDGRPGSPFTFSGAIGHDIERLVLEGHFAGAWYTLFAPTMTMTHYTGSTRYENPSSPGDYSYEGVDGYYCVDRGGICRGWFDAGMPVDETGVNYPVNKWTDIGIELPVAFAYAHAGQAGKIIVGTAVSNVAGVPQPHHLRVSGFNYCRGICDTTVADGGERIFGTFAYPADV